MSIPIDQFEEHIHVLIAERGKEYWEARQVLLLEQTSEGWTAVIEGREPYQVLLEGHDVIENWHCTCPFEHGPVCKHIAAAFYAVREAIRINQAVARGEMDQWIDRADPDNLRQFLKLQIRKHHSLRQAVFEDMHPKSE